VAEIAGGRPTKRGEKVTRYFTFGQGHAHHVSGHLFGPDTLVKITAEDPRAIMVEWFGSKWGFEYSEPPDEKYWKELYEIER
jgi:hypothetical protein